MDHLLDLEEDDLVFVPTGWDFAVDAGIRVDPDADAAALDELADHMLVSLEDRPGLERATEEAVERIWSEELADMIRECVETLGKREAWAAAAAGALAELDRDPRRAEVTREIVRHLAMQLAQHRTPVLFCLHCVEESLVPALSPTEARAVALQAALATCRTVDVSENELRAVIRNPAAVGHLGTSERRIAVRAHLRRLALTAADTLPRLAPALRAIADEPLPADPRSDDVWCLVVSYLLAEVATAEAN